MNLRHIDPRSTDWMDAMLEGEPQSRRKREMDGGQPEQAPGLVAAAQGTAPPGAIKEPPPDGAV